MLLALAGSEAPGIPPALFAEVAADAAARAPPTRVSFDAMWMVQVTFVILPGGSVFGVHAIQGDRKDPETARQIVEIVRTLRFERGAELPVPGAITVMRDYKGRLNVWPGWTLESFDLFRWACFDAGPAPRRHPVLAAAYGSPPAVSAAPVPAPAPDNVQAPRLIGGDPSSVFTFPVAAQILGFESGVVVVEFDIRADGTPASPRVVYENPAGAGFGIRALEGIQRLRFEPRREHGRPTEATGRYRVRFATDDRANSAGFVSPESVTIRVPSPPPSPAAK
jgi:TonB family protein